MDAGDGLGAAVSAAAGGIGTAAVQLAVAWGGRVIAVVSTQDKVETARAAGAHEVVLADGFRDAVRDLTSGRGVDVVVDPVGGDRFTDSLRSLAPGGRFVFSILHPCFAGAERVSASWTGSSGPSR